MLTPKCCLAAVAMVAVSSLSSVVSAGALSAGVCYSPWHHTTVNNAVLQTDFAQMKQHFSAVRTYHARFSGVNVIDAAAQAGIKVAVGVMMQDKSQIGNEITAICEGAKRNPSAVQAVYVGNENLRNGAFGSFSGAELTGYINQVKGCVSSLGIPVGTVQRINEWLSAGDAAAVAAASDVIGVNVYPFFTPGTTKPVEKLDQQWKQMAAKYPESKLRLTETGWPRAGGTSTGNTASKDTMQSFLNDFAEWSKTKPMAYYFMMYDTKVSYTGQEYEKYFGLANTDGVLQVSIPSGNGQTSAPATTTAATTTATTTATVAKPATTTAATTIATATTAAPAKPAAATTAAPAAPAATTAKVATPTKETVVATVAPAATTSTATKAPTATSPANNAVQTGFDPATVGTPTQVVTAAPAKDTAATPAVTQRLRKHKHKKQCNEKL